MFVTSLILGLVGVFCILDSRILGRLNFAQTDWVAEVRRSNEPRRAYWGACTPGYYNGQGDVSKAVFMDVYNSSEIDFWNMIEDWWNDGRFEGLILEPARVSAPVV